MRALEHIDEVPMRAQRSPMSSWSSIRADAWNSTVAFFTYRSPCSWCMASSYGSASARQ
jgi:hypothetical protein